MDLTTIKNLSEFVINVVDSDEVYEKMQSNGLVNDNELYLVKDEGGSMSQKSQVQIIIWEDDN